MNKQSVVLTISIFIIVTFLIFIFVGNVLISTHPKSDNKPVPVPPFQQEKQDNFVKHLEKRFKISVGECFYLDNEYLVLVNYCTGERSQSLSQEVIQYSIGGAIVDKKTVSELVNKVIIKNNLNDDYEFGGIYFERTLYNNLARSAPSIRMRIKGSTSAAFPIFEYINFTDQGIDIK